MRERERERKQRAPEQMTLLCRREGKERAAERRVRCRKAQSATKSLSVPGNRGWKRQQSSADACMETRCGGSALRGATTTVLGHENAEPVAMFDSHCQVGKRCTNWPGHH